jgi:hypothetical protein
MRQAAPQTKPKSATIYSFLTVDLDGSATACIQCGVICPVGIVGLCPEGTTGLSLGF